MGEGTGIAWMIQPQSQDRIDIWNLALALTHIVPQSHMMQLRYSLGISYTLTVLHHKLHAKYAHVPAPKCVFAGPTWWRGQRRAEPIGEGLNEETS